MNTILYNLVYDNKNTYSVNEYNKLPFEIYNQVLNPISLPFPRIEEIYRMKGGRVNYLYKYKNNNQNKQYYIICVNTYI